MNMNEENDLTYNEEFLFLEDEEIISLDDDPLGKVLNVECTRLAYCNLRIEDLIYLFKSKMDLPDEIETMLFEDGVDCQALQFNSEGWRTGKFRLKMYLEFCPDSPEEDESEIQVEEDDDIESDSSSPLDDLRKKFKQSNLEDKNERNAEDGTD